MPVITLPDGSQRRYDAPISVAQVAADIGPGLARAAVAGRVNGGQLVDTSHRIEDDTGLSIVTGRDPDGLEIIRHSTAHLLAQAVKQLHPDAQVTIGPVIEDGFYYDFAYPRGFTPEDLEAIEARMRELAEADLPVHRELLPRDQAVAYFRGIGEEYKARIIEDIPADEAISLYGQGDWKDRASYAYALVVVQGKRRLAIEAHVGVPYRRRVGHHDFHHAFGRHDDRSVRQRVRTDWHDSECGQRGLQDRAACR
jgi:threonyl-tRNA synthetase